MDFRKNRNAIQQILDEVYLIETENLIELFEYHGDEEKILLIQEDVENELYRIERIIIEELERLYLYYTVYNTTECEHTRKMCIDNIERSKKEIVDIMFSYMPITFDEDKKVFRSCVEEEIQEIERIMAESKKKKEELESSKKTNICLDLDDLEIPF